MIPETKSEASPFISALAAFVLLSLALGGLVGGCGADTPIGDPAAQVFPTLPDPHDGFTATTFEDAGVSEAGAL
jgi:hypothetical protein